MHTGKSESTVASLTVVGRLRRARGRGFYLLFVILTPVVILWAARQAYVRTTLPDPGISVTDQLAVDTFDARWGELRRGDRVLALDGEPLAEPADFVARSLEPRSEPFSITFARADREWTTSAASRPMRPIDQGALWARVATGAALMIMGLIAFLLRPGVAVTWLFLAVAWDLGLFLMCKVGFYADPALYMRAHSLPWVLVVSLGMHFFCVFPREITWVTSSKLRVALLYLPCVVMPTVQVLSAETQLATIGTAYAAAGGLAVAGALGAQYLRVRRSRDAQARSQYRALFVGFTCGLLLPGVWNWLRIGLGIGASPWSAHYNSLPLVLFIGLTAYAVVRHNALAIDRFTASIVGYAATTLLLGGGFAAALFGIPLLMGRSGLGDSPTLLVGITGLTFAGFAPAYRLIKRWVDRRFFREQVDAAQMAEALRQLVVRVQQSGRDEAIAAALEAAHMVNGDRTELWLLAGEGKELCFQRGSTAASSSERPPAMRETPVRLDGPLGQALRIGITAGVEGLSPRTMDTAAQEELWSKELTLAAPVLVHAVVAGFLGIGRKRSGAGFQLEELSFLSIVAAQLGSALERSQSDGAQLDRYHLERRIGTGGMAEVYLAWQVGPGGFERKVAVKRPLPHVSEDANAVAAFLDEARLAAQLQHPNIAQVFDVGESRGSYFIVMEYVDGPSLRHVLRWLGAADRIPLAIAVATMQSVLAALEHAHRRCDDKGRPLQLVHRDVTPRNVLMNRRGEVKLVDFGIARAQFQIHVTRTGTVKGTLPYMSPEQAAGGDVDARSDLYSAGAIFYELLTADAAYPQGPSHQKPPRPSTIEPDLPAALESVLDKAMAYDADDRYASATELSKALEEAIAPAVPASSEAISEWLASVWRETTTDMHAAVTQAAPKAPDNDAETVVHANKRE